MHIKRIHEMVEKLTECALCELNKGVECVDTNEFGEVVDAIKDLCEAEKSALIAKEMKKCEEEDEAEEKHFLKMLKDEHKDEYKRMREEYGEDEGERRFYDNYRYKSGRFAPKGRGSYEPRRSGRRRGYEEYPYMYMYPEMYGGMSPEEMRDMDRESMNRMYYSGDGSAPRMERANSTSAGRNMDVRGYEDGYRDGLSSQSRDRREGRSGQSRRRYFETKEENKGTTAEEKQRKLKDLESYMKDLSEDIAEVISDASNEERTMIKAKVQTLLQHI